MHIKQHNLLLAFTQLKTMARPEKGGSNSGKDPKGDKRNYGCFTFIHKVEEAMHL